MRGRLTLDADLLDPRQQTLLEELVELGRRLPDVHDRHAAVAEPGDVGDEAFRRITLPVDDRSHRVVLLRRNAFPPHLEDLSHGHLPICSWVLPF
jgi:hypothetical protein